jgi:predicted SAM-dependent methyltransferase
MPKINIGAGNDWHQEGWESLENGKGDYSRPCQRYGKAWDSKLPSNHYDILFAGNILEHITHFRIEKTLAEFNRLLKVGGTLRLIVPNLKKAAVAYVNGDEAHFKRPYVHAAEHLGIGSMFMNVVITPGHDVMLMSRELDELIGVYAHTYGYDFEMMKTYLEKWGFEDVKQSDYCTSELEELQEEQHIVYKNEKFVIDDESVRKYVGKDPENCYISGFDNNPGYSLYVEARKAKDEPYSFEKEFEYNRRGRPQDIVTRVKLKAIKFTCDIIDLLLVKSGLLKLARKISGRQEY